MSYLLIQNKNEVPLWGIRLLGRSRKSDPNAIGRFGTGLKESITLLHRLKAKLVIYSGTCRVDFTARPLDGEIEELCFKLSEPRGHYAAGRWHGLGLDPEFGHHDWTEPWQALREFFCNAFDEGIEFLHHDIVGDKELGGVAGTTRVFIETDFDVLDAYSHLPHRLLALSDKAPVERNEIGDILAKEEKYPDLAIYHKGVWVQEGNAKSLYDYNLHAIKLNESRSADWHGVFVQLGEMVDRHSSVAYRKEIIETARCDILGGRQSWNEYAESQFICSTYCGRSKEEYAGRWLEAWNDLFGPDCYAACNELMTAYRTPAQGEPIIFPSDFYYVLEAYGIPTISGKKKERDRRAHDTANPLPSYIWKPAWDWLVQHWELESTRQPPPVLGLPRDLCRKFKVDDGKVFVNHAEEPSTQAAYALVGFMRVVGDFDTYTNVDVELAKTVLKGKDFVK